MTCKWPTAEVAWQLKDRFLLTETPPTPSTDGKLHRKDNTDSLPKKNHLLRAISTPHTVLSIPFPSHLTCVAGAVLVSIRADKAPAPNPISCASKRRCCLCDPMLGDLHSNKERLTCFTTRHEEKKLHSGASWDFFFFFFCGGVETHIFLTKGESCLFSCKSLCE